MRLRSLKAAFESNSGDISRKSPSFFVSIIFKILLLCLGCGKAGALSVVSFVTNVSKIMPKTAWRIVSRSGCLLWQHKTWNHSLCVRVCADGFESGKKWEKKPVSALFQFGTVPCVPYIIYIMQMMVIKYHYWNYSSILCVSSFGGSFFD